MRKLISTLLLFCVSFSMLNAQIIKGDMNDDGKLTISDITKLTEYVLGRTPIENYNSQIAGTWRSVDGDSFTLADDGSASYSGQINRYEYLPYQNLLVFFDATNTLCKSFYIQGRGTDMMFLQTCGQPGGTAYYRGNTYFVSEVQLSSSVLNLNTGSTHQLTATVLPATAINKSVTWTSSDPSVAQVDATGKITAVGCGTTTITCTSVDNTNIQAQCVVSVVQLVTEIQLSKTSITLDIDETEKLTATILPDSLSATPVLWSSSDEDVAEVNKRGVVYGIGYGSATITCAAQDGSGVIATCTVVVKKHSSPDNVDIHEVLQGDWIFEVGDPINGDEDTPLVPGQWYMISQVRDGKGYVGTNAAGNALVKTVASEIEYQYAKNVAACFWQFIEVDEEPWAVNTVPEGFEAKTYKLVNALGQYWGTCTSAQVPVKTSEDEAGIWTVWSFGDSQNWGFVTSQGYRLDNDVYSNNVATVVVWGQGQTADPNNSFKIHPVEFTESTPDEFAARELYSKVATYADRYDYFFGGSTVTHTIDATAFGNAYDKASSYDASIPEYKGMTAADIEKLGADLDKAWEDLMVSSVRTVAPGYYYVRSALPFEYIEEQVIEGEGPDTGIADEITIPGRYPKNGLYVSGTSLKWGEIDETRAEYIWKVEAGEDGLFFLKSATGMQVANVAKGATVTLAEEDNPVTITYAGFTTLENYEDVEADAPLFDIRPANLVGTFQYLHSDGHGYNASEGIAKGKGGNVVGWSPNYNTVTLIPCATEWMFVKVDDKIVEELIGGESGNGSIDGNAYVDLGLPSGTLWATCNVGASSPEKYGYYFAWGETEGYPMSRTRSGTFNWSTYKWCRGSDDTMTKYCRSSSYGTVDNKTTLDLEDDAAYVNCGSHWRMPTRAQIDELINKCYWVWKSYYNNTDRSGYIVYKRLSQDTSTSSFSSSCSSSYNLSCTHIFLPAAGCRGDSSLHNAGSDGFYWSSSLNESSSDVARYVYFTSGEVDYSGYYRYFGGSVRPVCSE
ncbi:MAG: Ig-like domain-containing protein [Bacteroidales bacterium]|nr:Ig-like domain-containing protein [Bacteroidales bacterium]